MDEVRMLAISFARETTTALERRAYCSLHNITEDEFYQGDAHTYALAKACHLHFFGYCNYRGLGITMDVYKQVIQLL